MYKYLFFVLGLAVGAFADTQVFFTPGDACRTNLVSFIERAKKTLDVAVYSLTDQHLSDALEGAHARGVKVRVLTDRSQAQNKNSKIYSLYAAGVPMKVHSMHRLEHNKFAVIDGKFVETGSYNWTNSAANSNSENCLFMWNDPDTVGAYQARFDELWRLNSKAVSDRWFEKHY